ncbi:hypothetical protein [Gordonia hongkongensis]|uniref:hypothetical protein n=1 Tax=Gordonia hongkongensis TaxID=1701090 RepID=UPI003EC0A290
MDEDTRNVLLPHEEWVLRVVCELSEIIGQRAFEILGALKTSSLTPQFVAERPPTHWKTISVRTLLLVCVAIALETIFGARMAEKLAGTQDNWSWLVGVAVATLLTVSAITIANSIHTQDVGLLHRRGAWVALMVAVVAVAFLSAWAFGLGGGAKAVLSNNVISGGTADSGSDPVTGSSINTMLVIIYAALLLLVLSAVVLSHLYDEVQQRESRDMEAKKKVLTETQQKLKAVKLLRQCLVVNEHAKHRAHGLVMAYVAGARSTLPPTVNSAWDTELLENWQAPNSAWVRRVETEIRRLEIETVGPEVSDDDGDPPLFLVHRS